MVHYYLYIDAGKVLDESTKFYRVSCGSSKQASRDFLFLVAHSVDNGHFFELWSREVDDFYSKVRSSLLPGCKESDGFNVLLIPITARELVKSFKESTAIPIPSNVIDNRKRMLSYLNLNYRVSSAMNRD